MTVRVGKAQGSRAQFYLKRQSEVVRAVAYLVRGLSRVSAQRQDGGEKRLPDRKSSDQNPVVPAVPSPTIGS
jgi:hypothetical protein